MKHSNLYLELVLPSGGWQSLIVFHINQVQRRHDTHHNDIQHYGIQHYGIQHYGIQHYGIQHYGIQHYGIQQ